MAIEYAGSMLVFGLLGALSRAPSRAKLTSFVVLGLLSLAFYQWAFAMFLVGMSLALNDIEGYDHWLMSRCSKRAMLVIHHCIFFVGWYLLSQPSGPMNPKTSYETTGWWTLSQLIPTNYWEKEYWRWWNTWGALCVVYGVLRINWLQRFFTSRPLAYLGRISFMLYLTQAPILWTFADRIFRLFGQIQQENTVTWWDNRLAIPDWGIHGLTTRFVLSQIIVLPVQFLLAEIATRLIDVPSISVGRWIVARSGIEKK
jgi:peptidoglycan/LPS O-acetylase OafA/YrhL